MKNEVRYLGVKLWSCGSVEGHLRDRIRGAKIYFAKLRKLQCISMQASMKLLSMCVLPVVTYGLELIWYKLSTRNLAVLETVKARFLKRCLGVAEVTRNRNVYYIVGARSIVEDVMKSLEVGGTEATEEYLTDFRGKVEEQAERERCPNLWR